MTARVPGVRVVMDVRPLQSPEHAPVTAAYLEGLLGGLDASPLPGESFAFLLASDLDDPTARFDRLQVVGRRLLPPTRLLRSAALAVDSFVLRGASVGAGWRIAKGGAAGVVYHAAGGAVPLASGVPVVVTLLDLAPWELPEAYQRTATNRFGQRLRARLVREAAAVIVASDAVGRAARQLVHVRRDRLRTIPLAPRTAFRPGAADARGERPGTGGASRVERERLGLPERYFVYAGRYDARQDLATLLRALALLAAAGAPTSLPDGQAWPPRVCLLGATPADRRVARAGRCARGRRRPRRVHAAAPGRTCCGARRRGSGRAPAGRLGGRRTRRDRGVGGGRSGGRERRRADGRARRPGGHPGRAQGPGTAGRGAVDGVGRRRGPRTAGRCGAHAFGIAADVA